MHGEHDRSTILPSPNDTMMQLAVSLVPLPSPPPPPPPSYLPPPPSPNMRAFSSRPPIPASAGGLRASSSSSSSSSTSTSSSSTTSALYCLGGFAAGMAVSLAARRVRAARRWIATAEDSTYSIHTMLCTQGPPPLMRTIPGSPPVLGPNCDLSIASRTRFAHSLAAALFRLARRAMCAPRSLSLALLLHSLRPPQSPWPCGGQGTR